MEQLNGWTVTCSCSGGSRKGPEGGRGWETTVGGETTEGLALAADVPSRQTKLGV